LSYIQTVNYEQLPFKCKACHEYGNFAKKCPKAKINQPEDKEQEQWQQAKKKKTTNKSRTQSNLQAHFSTQRKVSDGGEQRPNMTLSFDKDQKILGPIPFKFNPLWLESQDFLPLFSSVWSNWVDGSPFFIWEQKLKRTKKAIKDWIKNSPHNPREEVEKCKKQLEELQEDMEFKEINNK
jgi:hypothetical protein